LDERLWADRGNRDDSRSDHDRTKSTTDGHAEAHGVQAVDTRFGRATVEIDEAQGPARFRVRFEGLADELARRLSVSIATVRPNGTRAVFSLAWHGDHFESADVIPEPHEFVVELTGGVGADSTTYGIRFEEPLDVGGHAAHRDHNLRAAFVHVAADAAVSVLAILGLVAARYLGWVWMDPMMGIVGGVVIALWAYALVRDTGRILLDMTPDTALATRIRRRVEAGGDRVADLHLWRLGPGHLGAILSIVTGQPRDSTFYRTALEGGDFPYTIYIDRMTTLIGQHWLRPQVTGGTVATVSFVIDRDGTIRDAKNEISSGNGTFDRAALRAVLEASPLPPLPFGYSGTYLGVHLNFR